MTERAAKVRRRAEYHCEYCRVPQAAFCRPFHIEHIVAREHGGGMGLDNLALACWHCNLKKGPNLAGVDLETGEISLLFHPRKDVWAEHFSIGIETLLPGGIEIRGLSPAGRASAQGLGFNDDMRQLLRYELWLEGLYGSGG